MPCTVGIDEDGRRFIACRRLSGPDPIAAAFARQERSEGALIPKARGPWDLRARIVHRRHGAGTITETGGRGATAYVCVSFDYAPATPIRYGLTPAMESGAFHPETEPRA